MADRADNESLPLQGVVLCCTSLPQEIRVEFASYATEMGAIHNLDLTSEVTHLIVGDITTPKYRYTAKDRPDIVVLSPEWIRDVRKHWMEGGVVDVPALEKLHKLPTFYGLKICVTGFQDPEMRESLETRIKEGGAQYFGDLTKQVTHLIAKSPQGEKYKFALQWGLRVVSLQWFSDSLERGMALDESLYDPVAPPQEQGKGAFRRQNSLGKRSRSAVSDGLSEDPSKRKLRRTASTKLHSQSQDLWNDISVQGGQMEQGEVDRWAGDGDLTALTDAKKEERPQNRAGSSITNRVTETRKPKGLFSGRFVLIHGFNGARATRLREHLVPNGATVVDTPTELYAPKETDERLEHYLLVPHSSSIGDSTGLPDVPDDTLVVSEWWLERCISHKSILSPGLDPLCRPLWAANRRVLEGVKVCTTGFSSLDFRQSVEALKIYGAEYCAQLDPDVTVLVSGSEKLRPEKALYASKHSIPVVSADWIWACLNTNSRPPFDDFLITLPKYTPHSFGKDSSTSSPDLGASGTNQPASSRATGKDEPAPKRLSSTKPADAKALSFQSSIPQNNSRARRQIPFILEDDDDDSNGNDNSLSETRTDRSRKEPSHSTPGLAREATGISSLSFPESQRPLEERSPNASPRKREQTPLTEKADVMLSTVPSLQASLHMEASHQTVQQRLPQELAADLASILQRATSRSAQSTSEETTIHRRKNRPLGRNLSGTGIVQAQLQTSSSGRPSSTTGDAADTDGNFADDAYDESYDTDYVPPGTQLGYETIEAAAHRLEMERLTKGNKTGATGRVKSMGTAKDVESSRAQTRQRRNRT